MVIESQPYGLSPKTCEQLLDELKKGKAGILPTDSVYAFVCLSDQKSGFEAICKLKHLDPKDAMMSIVCKDLSQASDYFVQWQTSVYRILNKNLPGPFTFILQSGHRAPAFLKNKRKTLGLRIPQHPVIEMLMGLSDMPLLVSSVRNDDEVEGYFHDSEELIKRFEKQVGFIVTDEDREQEASTIVDMTGDDPVILRQSKHELRM
ncbi:MAG: L-threonylcarbamoyladenylate synthase [Bacteroidota bacterium]|nr:L-threonylcarbamoyladenylate synthase [Bacteroidota bacterium]